jgi:ribosomal protein S18 acetylase RimI-like enzyme
MSTPLPLALSPLIDPLRALSVGRQYALRTHNSDDHEAFREARGSNASDLLDNSSHPLACEEGMKRIHSRWLHKDSGILVESPNEWYRERDFRLCRGKFFLDGNKVGDYSYSVAIDDQDELRVHICAINLDEDLHSCGFGRAFYREIENRYRESGAHYITLNATGVGGYFWAKEGFLFDPRRETLKPLLSLEASDKKIIEATQETLGRKRVFRELTETGRIDPKEITLILSFVPLDKDLEEGSIDSKILTPYAISQLGRENSWIEEEEIVVRRGGNVLDSFKFAQRHEMWLGKKLLMRTTWSAVKPLL